MRSTHATTEPRTIGDATAAWLRETSIAVVACGVAGALVGGVGSRLAMRVAAIAAPEARGAITEAGAVVGEITMAGTIGLVLFAGLGSAVLGAGTFTVLRPWLPGAAAARGVVFGSLLLALLGTAVIDPSNADFVILDDGALNVSLFSGLFVAFGLVAAGTVRLLGERWGPSATPSLRTWLLSLLMAVPIVPGVAGLVSVLGPPLGIPLVASSAGMLAAGRMEGRGRHRAATWVRILATAAMATVVLLAAAGYFDAVLTIL